MIVLYQDERGHRYKRSTRQAVWTDDTMVREKTSAPQSRPSRFTTSLITASFPSGVSCVRGVHASLCEHRMHVYALHIMSRQPACRLALMRDLPRHVCACCVGLAQRHRAFLCALEP
jgi:hypothetical protein